MQKGSIGLLVILIGILVGVLVTAGAFYYSNHKFDKQIIVTDFESCAAAGNPIMESYPAQCRSADGKHFVQQISDEEKQKLVPPADKSIWKNANYAEYAIEFKYPVDWNKEQEGIILTSHDYKESENPMLLNSGVKLSMNRYKSEKVRSLDLIADEFKQTAGVSNVEKIKVGNYDAVYYQVEYEGFYDKYIIPVDGYDWYFTIQFGGDNPNTVSRIKDKHREQIHQILSSIHFE